MAIMNLETKGAPSREPDIDLATTRPGTPGGIFFRKFWQAIGRSVDFPAGKTAAIRIMSEDYTLYRGVGGKAQVVQYRCPHRGVPLYLGWVEGEDLRCSYHGWKYNCSGQCIEMPAEEPGYEKKVKLKTYPTEEAHGLVYAYFGEGAPPQFPPYPEPEGEGITDCWPTVAVPCNYLQSHENGLDEVHVAFTHQPGGSHAALAKDLPIITAEETDWGLLRFGTRANGQVRHSLNFMPAIHRVIVPPLAGMDGFGGWTELTIHRTPVDDENHLWVNTGKVRISGPKVDLYWQKRVEFHRTRATAPDIHSVVRDIWSGKVSFADARHPELAIVQDITIQAAQGRIADRKNEFLGRSDAGIIMWRRILARELRAIAEGKPTKNWRAPRPEEANARIGI